MIRTLSRHGNFATWKFLASQTDDLGIFLTNVTTFHDLCMTMMSKCDDILITPKTTGEDTLATPMNGG